MASYVTVLACGGFEYDGPAGVIGFAPRLQADNLKRACTAAEGWGTFPVPLAPPRHARGMDRQLVLKNVSVWPEPHCR